MDRFTVAPGEISPQFICGERQDGREKPREAVGDHIHRRLRGTTLAIDEVNASGGVLGRKVDLLAEDSVTPQAAVTKAQKLIDPDAPTRFAYREAAGVVWGDYRGDTVREGRFVAVRRGDEIDVSFVHALASGEVVAGGATSRIEADPDRPGALLLVEDFAVDGIAHRSVCAEVLA